MAKAKSAVVSKNSILTPASLAFLKKYLNTPSPVGFESEGQKLWIEYLKPYIDSYFTDSYGTGVGVINPKSGFRVVIEAHADEISWFVNYINPEGLMYLKRNGGVDHQVAPGQRVNHTWIKRTGESRLRVAGHSYPYGYGCQRSASQG